MMRALDPYYPIDEPMMKPCDQCGAPAYLLKVRNDYLCSTCIDELQRMVDEEAERRERSQHEYSVNG